MERQRLCNCIPGDLIKVIWAPNRSRRSWTGTTLGSNSLFFTSTKTHCFAAMQYLQRFRLPMRLPTTSISEQYPIRYKRRQVIFADPRFHIGSKRSSHEACTSYVRLVAVVTSNKRPDKIVLTHCGELDTAPRSSTLGHDSDYCSLAP